MIDADELTSARPPRSTNPPEPSRSTKCAMHARLLNGISLVAGTGFSLGLFLSIAQFLSVHEQAAPQLRDDLEELAVATLPPPPPPPKPDDKPPVIEELRDAIPLGIQEEPSASPVKIPPSPPSYEQILPIGQLSPHAVVGMIMDTPLKPTIDVVFDPDRVYQKSEVDKPPVPISRPEPSVPAHLRNDGKGFSVVVVFVVDAHGMVGTPRISRSSGNPEFDAIITANIGEWKFTPAIKKGKPVRCMVQQLVQVQWGYRDPFSL